jgi:hypothetical protein
MNLIARERYIFELFVHYEHETSKPPQLVVHPTFGEDNKLSDEEAAILHKHVEDTDIGAALSVTRTVTTNIFHQQEYKYEWSVRGSAAAAAVDYLKKVEPEKLQEFFSDCWNSARTVGISRFPKRFEV